MGIGFFLLFKGGDYLVTGAAGIAHKKNIPSFIVGITLVAFGTSSPELFFNIISALHGNAEFALSNVSGSNLINIGLGIGGSAVVAPLLVPRQMFAKDLLFLCLGPAAVMLCVYFTAVAGLTFFHGLLLFLGFGVYIYLTQRGLSRHNQEAVRGAGSCEIESCRKEWLLFVVGCIMLYGGGEVIYRNALVIVRHLGLSESVVGLTVIAVGNILGSNIFNIFLVLAATAVVFGQPMAFSASNYFDFGAVCLLSVLFSVHVLIRQKIGRIAGVVLLTCYPAILYVRIAFFSV